MRSIRPCLALAVVALPGCYLFHGIEGAGSSIDAGSMRADAVRPPSIDASDPPVSDAGPARDERDTATPDSGPPLPRAPEPDPGPDGRPSDDPDDWVDPPDLGADEPCCVLGDPVLVTSREAGTSLRYEPPLVAWRPGRWALAVTRYFERSEGTARLGSR